MECSPQSLYQVLSTLMSIASWIKRTTLVGMGWMEGSAIWLCHLSHHPQRPLHPIMDQAQPWNRRQYWQHRLFYPSLCCTRHERRETYILPVYMSDIMLIKKGKLPGTWPGPPRRSSRRRRCPSGWGAARGRRRPCAPSAAPWTRARPPTRRSRRCPWRCWTCGRIKHCFKWFWNEFISHKRLNGVSPSRAWYQHSLP